MALTMHPVAPTLDPTNHTNSIIACVVTDLLGDIKGEWYSDSSVELLDKVHDLISYPDTKVYLYNTANDGNRTGGAFAMVTQSAYYDLSEIDDADRKEATV